MGKFGKGHLNNNGEWLLEYANETGVLLTNTLFQHKLAHRTTWTCTERVNPHNSADGTERRNSYRNKIDYIMAKTIHKQLITNSRSYGGLSTKTDHKLVKAKFKIQWWKMRKQHAKSIKINIDKFREPETTSAYKAELDSKPTSIHNIYEESPQETWKRLASVCTEAAISKLGTKKPNRRTFSTP